jgi:glycosyltransferase involved in cell wall biosynthesis
MKLDVISYKVCWSRPGLDIAFVAEGGFAHQMAALAALFNQTRLIITVRLTQVPPKATTIRGHNLQVDPLPEPAGSGLRRKLRLLFWLPVYFPRLWLKITKSDAVHALVPGDIGSIGILVALIMRKPLFVRHCGTWGEPVTVADRALLWLLERIAGGHNVVMATGGGDRPPSPLNSAITWIHSTTLTEVELDRIPAKIPWQPGEPVHLVTVGRLSRGKNMIDAVRALPPIQAHYPDASLHIVGDGEDRTRLEQEVERLGLRETVVFHGNVEHDEVLRILQACHLFVFPTKTKEGFPKAVLEALACGLPVVTTNVSVLPYLVGSERGVVLDEISAVAVANAVLDILSHPARFAEMVQSAQAVAYDYTLERWQTIIGERLQAAWGQPLRRVVEGSTN